MNRKKIIIIGSGTAGASAFAYLSTMFTHHAEIILISSDNIPTVGVGEATVGSIASFIRSLGHSPDEVCLGDAEGSIKYAVHLKDWYKDEYSYFTPIGLSGYDYHDYYFYGMSASDYWLSWNAIKFASNNKAPFLKEEHFDRVNLPNKWDEYAFNIDAGLFAKKMLEIGLENGGTILEDEVTNLISNEEDTISYGTLQNGEKVFADFWIDCSGFHKLIQNTLNIPVKKFKELGNNRAWATRIPYVNKEEELPYLSCVECQTMDAGWRWQIGLKNRIGTGYVFNNNYISEENAYLEFKNSFDSNRIKEEDCNLIKFETECMERQAGKNWIALGLSSGFVEPLESTSIFFMHNNLVSFVSLMSRDTLPQGGSMISVLDWDRMLPLDQLNDWNQEKIDIFNEYTVDVFKTTVDYIAAHYAWNQNKKSDFWIDWEKSKDKYLKICDDAWAYKNENSFFTRPGWSTLAVGNFIKPENFKNSHLLFNAVFGRQQFDVKNGKFNTNNKIDYKKIVNNYTSQENYSLTRNHLGVIKLRELMGNKFLNLSANLVDQHDYINGEKLDKISLPTKWDYMLSTAYF